MKNIILWDWDNTLVDTFGAILMAQNDMRVRYGLPAWNKEQAKMAMNKSGRNLIKDLVGEENAKAARAYFLEAYAKHAAAIELKEGAKDVLDFAKKQGYINILASNKAGPILRNEVETLGLTHYFDRIIGAEDTLNDKPSKEFTDAALDGYQASKIISIGDGMADIKMAHNYQNGIGILVWTNPDTPEFEKEKPDFTMPDLLSLKKNLDFLGVSKYSVNVRRSDNRCL